jgi:GNAT superfamily N-acetyltransferase
LLARLDGVAAGAAFAEQRFEAPNAADGEAIVRVLPELRRRGVGTALLRACSAHLQTLGKTHVQGSTFEDEPEALAFLAHRGFVEVGRNQTVTLELDRFEPLGRPAPPGLVLTDLAERPDLVEAVWAVDCEASPDIPGPEEEPLTLEAFRHVLERPGLDPGLIVVALAGDEAVGYAMLAPSVADPSRAQHWMTGVRRAWRGRGVASALKDAQLTRAKERGVRVVRTANELRNEPIRRLNARLGYRPEPEQIVMRGPLLP